MTRSTAGGSAGPRRAPRHPPELWRVPVLRTERITPRMVRVTVGGPELANFPGGGGDQHLVLYFYPDGVTLPEPLTLTSARVAFNTARPNMRSYTVRRHDPRTNEIDIDFVLHGGEGAAGHDEPAGAGEPDGGAGSAGHDRVVSSAGHDGATDSAGTDGVTDSAGTDRVAEAVGHDRGTAASGVDGGPGSAWAATARPGDQLILVGPSPAHELDPEVREHLLIGDETALPAIAALLEQLPDGVRARVLVEVADAAERQPLPGAAEVDVRWLTRDGAPAGQPDRLLAAASELDLDPDTHVWGAGERAVMLALRGQLLGAGGLPRRQVRTTAYWRLGHVGTAT
ncbi:MAG TPA: siderophore-interacting protein [Pseudonocardiaceae bacterium]|nr:siderophore-interacting protein [Pseudonocardiaceae bacterium]